MGFFSYSSLIKFTSPLLHILTIIFWDIVSFCSPGWPQIHDDPPIQSLRIWIIAFSDHAGFLIMILFLRENFFYFLFNYYVLILCKNSSHCDIFIHDCHVLSSYLLPITSLDFPFPLILFPSQSLFDFHVFFFETQWISPGLLTCIREGLLTGHEGHTSGDITPQQPLTPSIPSGRDRPSWAPPSSNWWLPLNTQGRWTMIF